LFTEKPVFECAFVHPMILYYRIWLKTVLIAPPKEHEVGKREAPGRTNRLRWLK